MNTQVLEYIVAISEEKSITKAAERFYLSQPSLSHHLANLERELGTKLFQREGRELRPTREGIIFINSARAILHAETQARSKIRSLTRGDRPCLRVCGALPGGMEPEQAGLGPVWGQELSWTPLDAAAARRALADQQQDLALVTEGEPFPQDPWDSRVLWQDGIQLALPACRMELPLSPDLAGLCYVTSAGADSLTGKMERSLEEAGLSPRLRCTAPDPVSAAAMVEAGLGAAFLPGRWIASRRDRICPMQRIPAWQARWRALLPPLTDPSLRTGREQLLDRLESWATEGVLYTGFLPVQEKG